MDRRYELDGTDLAPAVKNAVRKALETSDVGLSHQTPGDYADDVVCEGCGSVNSLKAVGNHVYQCNLCGHSITAEVPSVFQPSLNRVMVHKDGCSSPDYEYRLENDAAIITKYKGTQLQVKIPSHLQGFPVRVIGREAFKEAKITEVVFPDELLFVEDRGFYDCRSLSVVKGGSGLMRFGEFAFGNCYMLNRVDLQQDVDSQYSTFAGCFNLDFEPEHIVFC